MKKIVLIFFLLPFLVLSQKTNFTDDQIEFGEQFYKKLENTNYTNEEFLLEIEGALAKVPYFPRFVQSLLKTKFNLRDFKFMNEYCSRLDDNYLLTFQPIVADVCACAYFFNSDNDRLYNRIIPLITDKDTRDLFLSAYYYRIDNDEEFLKYAKSSMTKSYKFEMQRVVKSQLFNYFIALLNSKENVKDFSSFIYDYESTIFSSELNIPVSNLLIQSTIFDSDFTMAEKLIDYVNKLDNNNYKYLYPVSALYYSHKGEESLAIQALDNALMLEDKDFEKIINAGNLNKDVFNLYSMSLRKIEDSKNKERLISQAITYFKDRNFYWVRFKLYQSLLLASKDIDKARASLKECKPYLNNVNLEDLDCMIRMENELGKKNPNYRLVDDLMTQVLSKNTIPEMHFQRILYRYKVNYNSKEPIFSIHEIVDEFDKLLKYPIDRKTKLAYSRIKILIIAKSDIEWANRKLEKLPEDEAKKIIADLESTEILSQNLISNQMGLKDVNDIINFMNVGYISIINLKN